VTAQIGIDLGDGNDILTLGTFDAAIVPLTANGGTNASDSVTVLTSGMGLKAAGAIDLHGFQTVTVNNDIVATGTGTITLTAEGDLTIAAGVKVQTNSGLINLTGGNGGTGALSMGGTSQILSTTGNLRLAAHDNLVLGTLSTDTATKNV